MNVKLAKSNNLLLVCILALLPIMVHGKTLERIRASHAITLGYLPDFVPFSDQAADKASGYAIDLCLKIAEKVKTDLNLPELKIQYQPVSLKDEMNDVSSGKIDILCTPTPPTLARRKIVSYSVPIYTAGLSAVVRQNASEALLNVLGGKVAHTGPTWRATVNLGLSN